ncbi:MAG: hypothetical protein KJ614_03975 [Gammaproteobacteria bacterium]|uniref:hypothetical protein n=1 Tax=Rhodoferax sp. TaxID=50421 RepID=UPI001DA16831|nr:hypothetical protein [Rhodoferax sp.]MBU3898077.1 hypothetical protein [Gammaproteobacteria bacterium]MBU3999166.1 hypothetical protein [Gammaproteobacteria bacterium]MBU4081729.1 hypothetical protein [Gammaproteobacteria bacterium]MBU4114615.1 hypothetical protein [Gammaproteobacteria bacterium]MBU4172854.1 hypothetical protein [Gammaproteobacteria bacterium]
MKLLLSKLRSACALALCSSAWLIVNAGTLDASIGVIVSVAVAPEEAASLPAVQASTSAEAPLVAGWGEPVALGQLDGFRGGADLVKNDMQLSATVANNSASHVISGSNAIADGAFANMSGLPMVIQNSGSNVLIQSATIINVQFQ